MERLNPRRFEGAGKKRVCSNGQKHGKIWEAATGRINLICAIAMGFPSSSE